jgi:hypothetical protein
MTKRLPEAERLRRKAERKAFFALTSKDKIRAGTKRYREKIRALRAAGGPEWEAYRAEQYARQKYYRTKNREYEKQRSKDYWLRVRDRKNAERRAAKLANPEFFKARDEKVWRTRRANIFVNHVRVLSRKNGWACDLTKEWFQERLKAGVCEMSGLPFDMESKRSRATPSVDRIDPNGPYTKANCRMIIWFLNRALSNLGDDYALMVFERVLEKRRCLQLLAA